MSTTEPFYNVDVAAAIREVETRRGRTLAELAVTRELRNVLVETERVRNYVESCINADLRVDPETVLRLLSSCH